MNSTKLSIEKTLLGLRLSVIDGALANLFTILTGSVFLPAFALTLGAGSFELGVLAAIPFVASLGQLLGSFLVKRHKERKPLVVWSSFLSRFLWFPLVVLGILLNDERPLVLLWILMGIVACSHTLAAMSAVAWLSWMTALVPQEIRGRFFGLRNAVLGIVTISSTFLAGYFLDWFSAAFPHQSKHYAFDLIFICGGLAGLWSVLFLMRQPEPPQTHQPESTQPDQKPLAQMNFRRLLQFSTLWSFGVHVSSPFFLLYMLEDLHLSYTSVSIINVITAMADLMGMWIWGHISDRIGNRAIIIVNCMIASTFPACWILTSESFLSLYLGIPLLNFLAGIVWAGNNLCLVNLLFRMVPKEGNSSYFAFWSSFNGLASGAGALTGGILLKYLQHSTVASLYLGISTLKMIFLVSSILRLSACFLLFRVHEPESVSLIQTIKIFYYGKQWTILRNLFSHKSSSKSNPYWPIWRRK